jgi:hypothetical protein
MLAAWLCERRALGRRYTMVIGALVTMAFFFAYTAVHTPAQNVGFSCAIGFCLNIYYGTLYAYTPEVLPVSSLPDIRFLTHSCRRIENTADLKEKPNRAPTEPRAMASLWRVTASWASYQPL